MDLDIATGELAIQVKTAKILFPELNITTNSGLVDRAGLLKDVFSNKQAIQKYNKKLSDEVVGCNHHHEVGGRPYGWLHVNARGDTFLCCNDYNFDYVFGNLESNSIRDIWITDNHAETIKKSFNEICRNCGSAAWKKDGQQSFNIVKPKRKLTLGTTVYNDYEGLFFSLQAIRLYHPGVLNDIEFVVIDNNPESKHGKLTSSFIQKIKQPIKYIPFNEYSATSVKSKIFEYAETDYVLYFDSHVFFYPASIKKLLDFFEAKKDGGNLLQGPLIHDDLISLSTHFDLKWRGDMWGVWGTDQRGKDINAEPFEIEAQGMGVFACRKDSWLGFNPLFRGFGGEEGYIHHKYKKAGKKTLCLPFLRWMHRFGRPNGIPYPVKLDDKIRNYIIGFEEIGLDLNDIKQHFLQKQKEEELNAIFEKTLKEIQDAKLNK
jgi:hypothetical protein